MLGCICAPGRVILPEPLHHILDPPDLLLDLPVEHLILKVQIELLPEVIVQSRDLRLQVLILEGAARQGLCGGGFTERADILVS